LSARYALQHKPPSPPRPALCPLHPRSSSPPSGSSGRTYHRSTGRSTSRSDSRYAATGAGDDERKPVGPEPLGLTGTRPVRVPLRAHIRAHPSHAWSLFSLRPSHGAQALTEDARSSSRRPRFRVRTSPPPSRGLDDWRS
jgi:hypothetical protein